MVFLIIILCSSFEFYIHFIGRLIERQKMFANFMLGSILIPISHRTKYITFIYYTKVYIYNLYSLGMDI